MLIGTVSGCRTVSEAPNPIEIPQLEIQRPTFPLDELILAPQTDSDLLSNFLLLDTYTARLETYVDALESYIALIEQSLKPID